MDLPDIFSEIAVWLDDETLSKLITPRFLPVMRIVLADNSFWYRRSIVAAGRELQSRPEVEWRRVYRTLVETAGETLWKHLNYIPSLLVLEEAYGVPNWCAADQESICEKIEAIDVLHYLIDKSYLDPGVVNLAACLRSASARGREKLVSDLLCEIGAYESYRVETAISTAAEDAARAGHLSILTRLIGAKRYNVDSAGLLDAAIEGGHEDVMRYVLGVVDRTPCVSPLNLAKHLVRMKSKLLPLVIDYYQLSPESLRYLFGVGELSPETLSMIIESDPQFDWGSLLEEAVREQQPRLVQFILDQDDAVEITEEMMSDASLSVLAVLIRDSRSPDPMSIMDDLLREGRWKAYELEAVARLIMDDPRVSVEDMTRKSVTTALRMLGRSLDDRVAGSGMTRRALMLEALELDIYSLVIRFILLKNPTNLELVDWMISMEDEQLEMAASSVITDARIGPIWASALLSCMLYPTLTLEEALSDSDAGRVIVGVYLGQSGIRSRAWS